MSETPTPLPANPSLEQLRKRAKERVRQWRAAGNPNATLADALFALAREQGFDTWAQLKHHIEALRPAGIEPFERLAADLAAAYTSGDERLVRAINAHFGTAFPTDFHDEAKVRQQMPSWYASDNRSEELAIADARQMVAHAYGFENWQRFAASLKETPADPASAPVFRNNRPPFYRIDWSQNRLSAQGPLSRADWDEIFAIVEERGIAQLEAGGITDDAMRGLAELECVTHLNIAGSKALTDEGAQHLARMTQLRELEMGGWHTPLTDRAFEPLRQLKRLREFKACWTQRLTDAGAAHLAACDEIQNINLMGTLAGDGLIRAMAGKASLRSLETGRSVSDAGIPALHEIPAFAVWQGGEVRTGLMGAATVPSRLMLDGDFTDEGLGALGGLDGVASLQFFWHAKRFTAAGLEVLRRLAHLEVFGIDGGQCGDDAMRQIAAIPRLRQLQAQGAVAGDAGWQALSSSQSLEYIWGRECPRFGAAGFLALAKLPVLLGMGISCEFVEDGALAQLPHFPALRQFVSIGVKDAGFRHIGECRGLESLYCMYCRDTGDEATAHLEKLEKLRLYYAGMTQITDCSLEILGRMQSLEHLEFWQCTSLTDAGVAHLATLPKLERLELYHLPKVSSNVRKLFRDSVRVEYSG